MFAAARFSDLPELRDLRDAFQERYGNELECFVNQVFVEKLASKPPTMEKRLQLLQSIALEFSINWDSRGFKQRMAIPSTFAMDQPNPHGVSYAPDDLHRPSNGKDIFPESDKEGVPSYKLLNGKDPFLKSDKPGIPTNRRGERVSDGQAIHNPRDDHVIGKEQISVQSIGNQVKPGVKREQQTTLERDKYEHSFRRTKHLPTGKKELFIEKEGAAPKKEKSGSSSHRKGPESYSGKVNPNHMAERQNLLSPGKSEINSTRVGSKINTADKVVSYPSIDHVREHGKVNTTQTVHEQEADGLNSSHDSSHSCNLPPPYVKLKDHVVPPPYIKPKDVRYGISDGSKDDFMNSKGSSLDTSPHIGANAYERSHKRLNSAYDADHNHEKDYRCQISGTQSSSPRYRASIISSPDSIQKESDSPLNDCIHPYPNNIPLPKPRSLRRKHSKSSSNRNNGKTSEDARTVKRSSSSRRKERVGLQLLFDVEHHRRNEEERMMDKLLLHYSKKPSSTYVEEKLREKGQSNTTASPRVKIKDGLDGTEMVSYSARSISLPREQTCGGQETVKVFARANSFQPDKQAAHVHPKLPDYDDLAARFAALRGR